MKRRVFLAGLLTGLFVDRSFGTFLDVFRKKASSLPPAGKYTPVDRLFVVDVKGVPEVVKNLKLSEYSLKVYGKVKNPTVLSYDELKNFPSVKKEVILECVSNSKGDKIGKVLVEGVDLNHLLEKVGVLPQSKEVVFRSFDGYHTSVEMSYISEFKPVIAYHINHDEDGKVLRGIPLDHGYPVRVLCPEKWGYKSVKWLKEIEIVDYDYKGYWEKTGWNDRALRGVDYFDYR